MKETKVIKSIKITGSSPADVRKSIRQRSSIIEDQVEINSNDPIEWKRMKQLIKDQPDISPLEFAKKFAIFESQARHIMSHMMKEITKESSLGKVKNQEK